MFRRLALVTAVVALSACSQADKATAPLTPQASAAMSAGTKGFDELGYNDGARIFVGLADGSDGNLDGTVWGDPTYAKDHLVMKWNAAWDACNAAYKAGASAADIQAACAGAWTNNEWNGQVPGGSGESWVYKMKWVGPCTDPLADGGYCIWGDYEVIFSQGSVAGQHFWDAHARPAGYGGK